MSYYEHDEKNKVVIPLEHIRVTDMPRNYPYQKLEYVFGMISSDSGSDQDPDSDDKKPKPEPWV